jgi:hypothetical protein
MSMVGKLKGKNNEVVVRGEEKNLTAYRETLL